MAGLESGPLAVQPFQAIEDTGAGERRPCGVEEPDTGPLHLKRQGRHAGDVPQSPIQIAGDQATVPSQQGHSHQEAVQEALFPPQAFVFPGQAFGVQALLVD